MAPWDSGIVDLDRLVKEFGLKPLDYSLLEGFKDEFIVRRKLLIAHRDFDLFLKRWKEGVPTAIMSGIKPSGRFHLGSLRVAPELITFQRVFNAQVFYSIADVEAYTDNGLSYDKSRELAVSNVADLLALGLDPKKAYIYRQSKERRLLEYAGVFSKHTTMATLEAVYGHHPMGHYFSAMLQMADIYLPQHEDFGFKNVLVPVGLDQDPHIRLARDLPNKDLPLDLVPPSAIYHKTMLSLTGTSKMSKRDPNSIITLYDDENTLKFKLKNAFTGGRDTAEEQRRLGGRPEICPIYHLASEWFDRDDSSVEDRKQRCVKGELLCGYCKKEVLSLISNWVKEHKEKRDQVWHIAEEIVGKN